MDPVSWYLKIYRHIKVTRLATDFYLFRILLTHPWLTRSCLLITQGLIPAAAISIIFSLMWLGRGRPLMKTPPSWFTLPCPESKQIHKLWLLTHFYSIWELFRIQRAKGQGTEIKSDPREIRPHKYPAEHRTWWPQNCHHSYRTTSGKALATVPPSRATVYGGHMRTLVPVNTEVLEAADRTKTVGQWRLLQQWLAVTYRTEDTAILGQK